MRMNPLKEARLAFNWTQNELAREANITPNALIKNEQGLYPEPSNKVVLALGGDQRMIADYKLWRLEHLDAACSFFTRHKEILGLQPSGGLNPFICWRVHHLHIDSRLEFCKLLVLHPAVVQKYEQGEMRTMPESLYETLRRVGVSHDSVIYLNRLGESYYDRRKFKFDQPS